MNKRNFLIAFAALIITCLIFAACAANPNINNQKNDKTPETAQIVTGPENIEEAAIDYLVLVNKENKLPDDWKEKVQLSNVKNVYGDDIEAEKEALKKYN